MVERKKREWGFVVNGMCCLMVVWGGVGWGLIGM